MLRNKDSQYTVNGLICKSGIIALCESFNNMPEKDYPTEINVSDNHLKDEEFKLLVDSLRKKITNLNIKNNKLTSKGLNYLSLRIVDEPL